MCLDLVWIWVIVRSMLASVGCHLFMFFKLLFVHTFFAFWFPKVTPRLPQWSQNGVEIDSVGTLWEVLEQWYLVYGRHMGGSREESGNQFFPNRGT